MEICLIWKWRNLSNEYHVWQDKMCSVNVKEQTINSAARSYHLKTWNSDKQTEINISEFLTYSFKKCHVCLSFVIGRIYTGDELSV